MPSHDALGTRSRALVVAACALLASLAGAGCSRSTDADAQASGPGGAELSTVLRLVEHGTFVSADPRLDRGAYASLAHVARPTLTSAKAFFPELQCEAVNAAQPRAARACKASVPSALPEAPFAIFAAQTDRVPKSEPGDAAQARGPEPSPHGTAPGAADLAAPLHEDQRPTRTVLLARGGAPGDAGRLTATEIFFSRLFAPPPLVERTLTTEPFVVPADALLRLSIGVEESAWTVDSAPVSFRVVVEDEHGGSQQDLFRRVLDPARRPDDRRWFDSDVDLTDLAGKKVRLRFVSEPAERDDRRPSLPLWGDPRVLAPLGRALHPSIVLVSLDTLRAKSMSTYGFALDTSPKISALAAQGALFENAYSTFSNTLPSHMSMLTGLYPATHGVLAPPSSLGVDQPTLAEMLRAAGYATAAFTEDALLDGRRGFRRGFSTYFENTEIGYGAGDSGGTFGRALEWAGRNADEGFFLFVHTYEVHAPYMPPPPYSDAFDDPAGRALTHPERAYLQEIRYVDDVLQRLVDGLRRVVPERDLLLVVTADHGEEFLEHGMSTHNQLFDEVMHVPLVMVWPGKIRAGLRIANLVSLVDVTPTILALAGVKVPEASEGKSLVPLLRGEPADLGRDVVFGESPPITSVPERRYVARTLDVKCMLTDSGTGDACYDLKQDPGELEPRGTQDTPAFAHLHDAASAYRARSAAKQQVRAEDRRHVVSAASGGWQPGTPADAQEGAPPIERKLQALGYAE